jgi:radical SAM-linked protein
MRCVERTALRALVPLRFSQGFNPRPAVSLACPRPVGVASQADVAVMTMDDSAADMEAAALVDALTAASPRGMRFLRAQRLTDRKTLHPRRIEYALAVEAGSLPRLAQRLSELEAQDSWTVVRDSGQDKASRQIDLKPMVHNIRIEGLSLRWSQSPQGQAWARPSEALALLGLDPQADLSRVVRLDVEYD